MEGSEYRGYFGLDVIRIDENTSFEGFIGCALKETGDLRLQEVDGILGLSKNTNPLDNTPPFIFDLIKR